MSDPVFVNASGHTQDSAEEKRAKSFDSLYQKFLMPIECATAAVAVAAAKTPACKTDITA